MIPLLALLMPFLNNIFGMDMDLPIPIHIPFPTPLSSKSPNANDTDTGSATPVQSESESESQSQTRAKSSGGGARSPLWDGLRVILAGMFFEFARRGVQGLFDIIWSGITITARIEYDDEAYDWLYFLLAAHTSPPTLTDQQRKSRYSFFSTVLESIWPTGRAAPRDVVIASRRGGRKTLYDYYDSDCDSDYDGDDNEEKVQELPPVELDITPKPGITQTINFQGKTITLLLEDDKREGETKRWFILSAAFATHQLFELLIHHARQECMYKEKGKVAIYLPDPHYNSNWRRDSSRPGRAWNSVILPPQVKDYILADTREFMREKTFYAERGLPYRRGYLLYGLPGSGKTTLIGAIAAKLKVDIYAINLGSKSLDDSSLQTILSRCPSNCIVLIEDIDCAFRDRKAGQSDDGSSSEYESDNEDDDGKKKAKVKAAKTTNVRPPSSSDVTLSGLLNALDGLASSDGRLLFCTTNHVERIDSALSRPGRCDVWVEFTHATPDQARQLFLHFYSATPATSTSSPRKKIEVDISIPAVVEPRQATKDITSFGELSFAQRLTPPATPKIPEKDIDQEKSKSAIVAVDLEALADEFATIVPPDTLTVSALQGYLMRYKRQPVEAIAGAREWVQGGFKQNPTATLTGGKVVMKHIEEK